MNYYISFLKEIAEKASPIALKYFENPDLSTQNVGKDW